MSLNTLGDLFLAASRHDKPDCMLHRTGGRFRPISTVEMVDGVRRAAAALVELGVRRGDRVALMADNGPHWPTIDFAALGLGAALAPVYTTLTPEQSAYVIHDSGARIAFVENPDRLAALLGERERMPNVERFVLIGEPDGENTTLSELLQSTSPMDAAAFENEVRAARPEDLATLIYTSGTTGNPKGVMLSHGNLASNIAASHDRLGFLASQTALSFMPLSHSLERTVDYIYFYVGVTIAYAESIQTVMRDIQEVDPHIFVSVPRMYEKVLDGVKQKAATAPTPRRQIFEWAMGTAAAATPHKLKREELPGLLGWKWKLADKLVYSKVKQAVFGSRFEMAVSGGAPLSPEVANFFWGFGMEIYEGYGLTETSPVLCVNLRGDAALGTVGPAIPGVELKIAEDGEILARGPNIMQGYYNLPEKTAEVIDADGWFHTGDIGELDEKGRLRITDRKKEIIVTAYGKNVAPAPIENRLKSSRWVSQAVVIGDRRKFLSALIVPDFEVLAPWAAERGLPEDRTGWLAAPEVRALYDKAVTKLNEELAGFEQIHAWELLPDEFSIEGGELTPTQKVKRRVIRDKYANVIERVYTDADARRES